MNETRSWLARTLRPTMRLDRAGLTEAVHRSADRKEQYLVDHEHVTVTTTRHLLANAARLRDLAGRTESEQIGLAEGVQEWQQMTRAGRRPIELVE